MKKIVLLLVLAVFSISNLDAQNYVQLMQDPNVNFYDVQKSFEEHWKGRPIRKGKGWKQFKRWEDFMRPRVYPHGNRFAPDMAWKETDKYFKRIATANGKTAALNFGNWEPVGPFSWITSSYNPGIGRVNTILQDPNNASVLYVGVPSGGLWKSSDSGATWNVLTDTLPVLGVSAVAVDHTNSNIIYIGTGDGDGSDTYSIGVLKSTDGGTTWNTTGLNWSTTQSRNITRLLMDPNNSSVLLAATSNGIYRTNDGGNTWVTVQSGSFRDMEYKPGDFNTIYAVGVSYYKSTDGGNTFSLITNSGLPLSSLVNRLELAVTPANPSYVYVLAGDKNSSGFYGVYRSNNSGTSYTMRSNSPNLLGWDENGNDSDGQSWYSLALAVSPTNAEEVYVGGVNIWKSTDGGSLWDMNAYWFYQGSSYPYVHADIHTLIYLGNTLYTGCDGGIFRTSDNGNSWQDVSAGLQIMQFYRISTSPTETGMAMGGAQDNGCNLLAGSQWTHVLGADGMEVIIDPQDPSVVYASSQNGGLNRSVDGGQTFNGITGSINEYGNWVTPYVVNPQNTQILYSGFGNVWKSTNRGGSWVKVTNNIFSNNVDALAISPSNPSYVYASSLSTINVTTNAGSSWQNITSGLPNGFITYISVSPTDPQKVWISMSGFTAGQKVYKSTNAGATWTNYSGTLPNLPVNCIVAQAGTDEGVYAGTDVGIYYRDNSTGDWVPFMKNLPNVNVRELEIDYTENKIYAGTYGRGMWISDLYVTSAQPPIANFSHEQTDYCEGSTVQFTNLSYFLPDSVYWEFDGGIPNTSRLNNPSVTYNSPGLYYVKLKVSNAIGADSVIKQQLIKIHPQTGAVTYPMTEGFENASFPVSGLGNLYDWEANPATLGWERTTDASYGGAASYKLAVGTLNNGAKASFITPAINFSGTTNGMNLSFRLAFARKTTTSVDKLEVYYSLDCGKTWTRRYSKSGANIVSNGGAPVSGNYIPADSTQWRFETFNTSALTGAKNVLLKFEATSDGGNNMYIDNINIIELIPQGITTATGTDIKGVVSPNPFANQFSYTCYIPEDGTVKIVLTDVLGREQVLAHKLEVTKGIFSFHSADYLSEIVPGVYKLSLIHNGQIFDYKIVAQ